VSDICERFEKIDEKLEVKFEGLGKKRYVRDSN